MVLFNYATKELTAKVVYYGPGLCGKTTNLQFIYDTLPNQAKGKMLSLATKTDRTLFFDFLPIELGNIRGMKTKIQLYTVPGQVFYDTTRKLVLKGADGVVFVVDSQAAMADANLDSFENLITNLKEQNLDIKNMPHIMQFNKRDMKNILPVQELDSKLNRFGVPYFEAVATRGEGVFESLKGISKLVLKHLGKKYGLEEEKNNGRMSATKPRPKSKIPDLPPKPGTAQKPSAKKMPDLPQPGKAAKPPSRAAAASKLDEIEFIDDVAKKKKPIDLPKVSFEESIEFEEEPSAPTTSLDNTLEPISTLDDSEVIELDDVDPLEIEELDDMAEIANMASESLTSSQNIPAELAPIEVPVSINLPSSLEGKPLRLQIDITFND